MHIVDLTVPFLQAIGLMAFTSMCFGLIARTELSFLQKSVLSGFMFGGGAIVSMMSPTELAPGIFFDGRTVFVGLGAAFGGVPAAVVAAALGAGYRFYVGGAGAISGMVGMGLAALLGLLWAHFTRKASKKRIFDLAWGGAFISCQFIAIYLLPRDLANHLMMTVFPINMGCMIVGTIILGKFLERERGMISSEEKLKRAAEIDYLTQLSNRRHFHTLVSEMQKAPKRIAHPSTLVMFDVDHFKLINDRWGHDIGDQALHKFADVLRAYAGQSSIVARMGGEEFAILIKETSLKEAETIVTDILRATRRIYVDVPGAAFEMTTSAGLFEFLPQKIHIDHALSCADNALYLAKKAGRDQLAVANLWRDAA